MSPWLLNTNSESQLTEITQLFSGQTLRAATGYFQDQLEEHRRLVQAARVITEKMLNRVAEQAGRRDRPVMNYGRDAVMAPAFKTAAPAVPLALNQVI